MISAVGAMKMGSGIFDTLQYANRLKAAGVPEKQAEAQVEMMREIIDDKLATKDDIIRLEKHLEERIALSEERTNQTIKELELRMTLAEPGRAKRWREARGSRRERAAFASEDRRRPVIVAFPSRRTSAATQTVTLILALW